MPRKFLNSAPAAFGSRPQRLSVTISANWDSVFQKLYHCSRSFCKDYVPNVNIYSSGTYVVTSNNAGIFNSTCIRANVRHCKSVDRRLMLNPPLSVSAHTTVIWFSFTSHKFSQIMFYFGHTDHFLRQCHDYVTILLNRHACSCEQMWQNVVERVASGHEQTYCKAIALYEEKKD